MISARMWLAVMIGLTVVGVATAADATSPTTQPSTMSVSHPSAGKTLRVLLPDGQPAVDAQVAVWSKSQSVNMQAGQFFGIGDDRSTKTVFVADADGRFVLPEQHERYKLFVIHDAGCAQILGTDVPSLSEIRLQPWGRVEGTLRIGAHPAAKTLVFVDPKVMRAGVDREPDFCMDGWGSYAMKTDDQGRFAFDRVFPGPATVDRKAGKLCGLRRVDEITVKPGELTTVVAGGKGRAVIGRLVLPKGAEGPVDWPRAIEGAFITSQETLTGTLGRLISRRPAPVPVTVNQFAVEADGTFRIDDVPAGTYQLEAPLRELRHAQTTYRRVGEVTCKFTIPSMPTGRCDQPLDLGTLTIQITDWAHVKSGDLVLPSYIGEPIDRKTLSLPPSKEP